VLDAERTLFSAELSLAEARRAHLAASVDLYRALGGGWTMPAP
jgi:multidrug efflux system outer membrane protein